jgi:hypothetical protein
MEPRCVPGKRLCVPRIYPGPSGMKLRHSPRCPDKPGERIHASEYVGSQPEGSEPWRWRRPRW